MADRAKRGEDKNTKIWKSPEQKELFRWNEKNFSVFEGISFEEKYWTQVLLSHKQSLNHHQLWYHSILTIYSS